MLKLKVPHKKASHETLGVFIPKVQLSLKFDRTYPKLDAVIFHKRHRCLSSCLFELVARHKALLAHGCSVAHLTAVVTVVDDIRGSAAVSPENPLQGLEVVAPPVGQLVHKAYRHLQPSPPLQPVIVPALPHADPDAEVGGASRALAQAAEARSDAGTQGEPVTLGVGVEFVPLPPLLGGFVDGEPGHHVHQLGRVQVAQVTLEPFDVFPEGCDVRVLPLQLCFGPFSCPLPFREGLLQFREGGLSDREPLLRVEHQRVDGDQVLGRVVLVRVLLPHALFAPEVTKVARTRLVGTLAQVRVQAAPLEKRGGGGSGGAIVGAGHPVLRNHPVGPGGVPTVRAADLPLRAPLAEVVGDVRSERPLAALGRAVDGDEPAGRGGGAPCFPLQVRSSLPHGSLPTTSAVPHRTTDAEVRYFPFHGLVDEGLELVPPAERTRLLAPLYRPDAARAEVSSATVGNGGLSHHVQAQRTLEVPRGRVHKFVLESPVP